MGRVGLRRRRGLAAGSGAVVRVAARRNRQGWLGGHQDRWRIGSGRRQRGRDLRRRFSKGRGAAIDAKPAEMVARATRARVEDRARAYLGADRVRGSEGDPSTPARALTRSSRRSSLNAPCLTPGGSIEAIFNQFPRVIKPALPPAAAVLTETVRSLTSRKRL